MKEGRIETDSGNLTRRRTRVKPRYGWRAAMVSSGLAIGRVVVGVEREECHIV